MIFYFLKKLTKYIMAQRLGFFIDKSFVITSVLSLIFEADITAAHVTDAISKWLIWGYYCSPLTYGYIALAANEMHSPRWMDKFVS